jgi:DNA-binding CsgD family transcriptional regulator/tetratricopeptide (TPR) repeat protein
MPDDLIGRTEQIAALTRLLGVARAGQAAAVVVVGQAGAGKSRLLQELERRATDDGAVVMRGSCMDLGTAVIPYVALTEALRRFARDRTAEDVERLGGRPASALRDLLSGAGPAGAGSPALVFGAVLQLFDHIGAHQPLVMLLEDLQWADPSTMDLLTYLTRAMTTERVLLVGSVREDKQHSDHLEALLTRGAFERIDVPLFTRDELRRFAALWLPAPIGPGVLERCFGLSGGNPLYAAYLLRAGTGAEPAAELPTELASLMRARIRPLDGSVAGEVLKLAAVVGRAVRHRLLMAVSGLDGDTLNRALHECVDRGLLVQDLAQNAYTFSHGVLRETVYGELLLPELQDMHHRVAEAIDADHDLSLAGGQLANAELAYQWRKADAPARALPALIRAGDAERAARAFPEAELHYAEALTLWDRMPGAAAAADRTHDQVLMAAADVARWAGHVPSALTNIRRAIREVDAEQDPQRAGELYERLGSYLWENNESTAASRRAFEDAIRVLGNEPSAALVRAYVGLSMAEIRVGRYALAVAPAQQAVQAARLMADRAMLGRAQNALGSALTMQGNAEAGITACRAALEIAKSVGEIEDLFRAYGNLGLIYEHSGDLEFAAEIAREGLDGLRELKLGQTRQASLLANNLAATLSMLGEWTEAAKLIDDILANGTEAAKRFPRLTLAEIEVARGRFERAEALLAEIKVGPGEQDPRFQSPFFSCTAELALWRQDELAAAAAVSAGLSAVQSVSEPLSLLRLCAVGLRAAAEEAARGDLGAEVARAAHVRVIMGFVRQAESKGERRPELRTLVRLCETEHKRISGNDTAEDWTGLAAAWVDLQRPYPEAYARLQEACAARRAGDRSRMESALRLAYYHAFRIGAAPLRTRIEELAAEVHIRVRQTSAPAIPRQRTEVKLTPREHEVAGLLVQGRTYQQIATQLNIAIKTVNTHLEKIYRKVGAHSALETAKRLRELGLVA